MRVTFFLPEPERLADLRTLDPDAGWQELMLGEHAWILQTFLRLQATGREVELSDAPRDGGIVVFHARHRQEMSSLARSLAHSLLVGVRGDRREPLVADVQILQNRCFEDGRTRFFVPHWPQPGLLPRDPTRGDAVRRLTYKGFRRNLHPAFRTPEWAAVLADRGIEWAFDSVEYAGSATESAGTDWRDFREADLVLAVRPPSRRGHREKPATKLQNAWLAGVPALLGVEPAYRELRRSDLDYLEVESVAEAEAALDRLLGDPRLYRAMVENGHARARELDFEAVTGAWERLLFQELPARLADGRLRPPRHVPLWLLMETRRWRRILSGLPAK